MFVHRGQRAETHADADFLKGGRVAMFLHKVGDVVVNLPLPLGNRHAAIVGEGKANVKGEGNYPFTVGIIWELPS